MTVFSDWNFYKTEYLCGKEAVIDTASFKFYAKKATQKIKAYTLDNIDENDIPECAKFCCCEIAELLYNTDNSGAGNGIASESVGDQSISYESSDSLRQGLAKNIKSIIYSYLSGTGLLYRGVK